MLSNNGVVGTENLVSKVREKYDSISLKNELKKLSDLKVLVIGDAIWDEYSFCESIERSKKEPILIFEHDYSETYPGGIFAIANHVAEYSDNVVLLSVIGNDLNSTQIAENGLNSKIEKVLFKDENNPTLTKKRYIYSYKKQKMFEVYSKRHDSIDLPKSEIISYLEDNLSKFDVVVVADFGHGMISDEIVEVLCRKSKYLAVNVQTNNGNLGFNFITKFKRADFISITIEELMLALQDNRSKLDQLIKKLKNTISCDRINITLGKLGLAYFENEKSFFSPIFSKEVVDTVGAGDAVLSIASLLSLQKKDPIIVPFLGSCMGALAVKIMGNKKPVSSRELLEFADEVLKSS